MVEYKYNAWGLCKITTSSGEEITDATHIGRINPFRYRGYYYSEALGLYYLKSRFYDPEVGRFISADTVDYLSPNTINGLNLYAYCGNNPVMNVDPDGHFVLSTFLVVLFASTLIGAVSGGVAAVRAGQNFWKGFAAGAIAGAVGGAILAIKPTLIVSLIARVVGSFVGSISNDLFQTGMFNFEKWGGFALDAGEDALMSTLYFNSAPALAGNLLSPLAGDTLKRGVETAISGMLDFKVDNFQAKNGILSLPRILRSAMDNFWNSVYMRTANKESLTQ